MSATISETKGAARKKARTAVRKMLNERKLFISFTAFESEKDLWVKKAAAEDRPLSQWLRLRLLRADALDEERATRASESHDGRAAQ